ncbi:hypothetical protein B0H13DRAFT_1919660 [Mycena leptocephala]|nr:hypothetical protein B0H13DRAFT_1919660 [Mycena leptocephala]
MGLAQTRLKEYEQEYRMQTDKAIAYKTSCSATTMCPSSLMSADHATLRPVLRVQPIRESQNTLIRTGRASGEVPTDGQHAFCPALGQQRQDQHTHSGSQVLLSQSQEFFRGRTPKESALKIVHVTPPPKSPAPAFANALAVELGRLHIKMAELHAQASTFEPRATGTPSLASMQLSPASAVAAKLGYGMTCLQQINNAALNLGKYAPLEQARAQ